jgi:hypothetical protein
VNPGRITRQGMPGTYAIITISTPNRKDEMKNENEIKVENGEVKQESKPNSIPDMVRVDVCRI